MTSRLLILFALVLAAATARAGDTENNTIWITEVNQNISVGNYSDINSCWVVQNPTGSSDFFAVCFKVVPGIGNTDDVADGLPVTGIGVSLCIPAGGAAFFPRIGVYPPAAPGFCTPDLTNPIVELLNVTVPGPVANEYIFFDTPEAFIPAGTPNVIAAIQLSPLSPPGAGIGGDSSPSVSGTSYFSLDGFSTPAILMGLADMGLSIGQDNTTTTSCTIPARLPHGRMRVARGDATSGFGTDPAKGDRLQQHIQAGESLRLSFFGPQPGDLFLLTFMSPVCTPLSFLQNPIPTLVDTDGDGSYQRLSFVWPSVLGSFDFSALWANFSCTNPIVGFTNCVKVISP